MGRHKRRTCDILSRADASTQSLRDAQIAIWRSEILFLAQLESKTSRGSLYGPKQAQNKPCHVANDVQQGISSHALNNIQIPWDQMCRNHTWQD